MVVRRNSPSLKLRREATKLEKELDEGSVTSVTSADTFFHELSSSDNLISSAYNIPALDSDTQHRRESEEEEGDSEDSEELRGRSVRFDETKTEYIESQSLSFEEWMRLWYTAEDCKRFKRESVDMIKAMRKKGGKNDLIGPYYEFRNPISNCFRACVHARGDTGDVLTKNEKKELKESYKKKPERLGLERMTLSNVRQDKKTRRQCLRSMLLAMQQHECPHKEEMIRTACEAITLPSRLFAQHLGAAVYLKLKIPLMNASGKGG